MIPFGNDIICEDRELKAERMFYIFVQSTRSGLQVHEHICLCLSICICLCVCHCDCPCLCVSHCDFHLRMIPEDEKPKVERMLYIFVQSTISGVRVPNHICPG